MVILDSNHKLKTPQLIDKFVCAEIPNIKTHPILHQIISKNMIHGPCGAKNPKSSCMENNICRKNFPKNFCQQTNTKFFPKLVFTGCLLMRHVESQFVSFLDMGSYDC